MWLCGWFLTLVVTAALIGCRQEQPANPEPADPAPRAHVKPYLVRSNDGIRHEFYRDVSLDDFLKQLPSDSVDFMEIGPGQVFALVKVLEPPEQDLATIRFETTFKTQYGQAIEKRWTTAKARKPGQVTAVFSLPALVIDGRTKVVQNGD